MLPCSLSKKTSAILHFTHQHQHECISILNFTILLPPPAQARSSRMLPEEAPISDNLCVVVKHKKWNDFIHCCITHFKQEVRSLVSMSHFSFAFSLPQEVNWLLMKDLQDHQCQSTATTQTMLFWSFSSIADVTLQKLSGKSYESCLSLLLVQQSMPGAS